VIWAWKRLSVFAPGSALWPRSHPKARRSCTGSSCSRRPPSSVDFARLMDRPRGSRRRVLSFFFLGRGTAEDGRAGGVGAGTPGMSESR